MIKQPLRAVLFLVVLLLLQVVVFDHVVLGGYVTRMCMCWGCCCSRSVSVAGKRCWVPSSSGW